MKKFEIVKDDDGIKLHKWLRKTYPTIPLSGIHKALRTKKIKLNGTRAKGEEVLSEGNEVTVYIAGNSAKKATDSKPKDIIIPKAVLEKIGFLYEDEDLLVVDKPAQMAVHPGSGTAYGRSVIEILTAMYPDITPRLAHRLDKDTSGILLIAKHGKALRELLKSLRTGKFQKRYQTLVFGKVKDDAGTIDIALERHMHGQKITTGSGKRAVTHYKVVQRFADATLLEVDIETGRTHQIRAHFAAIGHPVCGDSMHGDFEKNKDFRKHHGLKRQFLHAAFLGFPHPESGNAVEITAPLAEDLGAVLVQL